MVVGEAVEFFVNLNNLLPLESSSYMEFILIDDLSRTLARKMKLVVRGSFYEHFDHDISRLRKRSCCFSYSMVINWPFTGRVVARLSICKKQIETYRLNSIAAAKFSRFGKLFYVELK